MSLVTYPTIVYHQFIPYCVAKPTERHNCITIKHVIIYSAYMYVLLLLYINVYDWSRGLSHSHIFTEGEVIRLYKGKGEKGKCSNERGITLASNAGKLFERIINRITPKVKFTEAQGGGQKGKSTADHILILNSIIKIFTSHSWMSQKRMTRHG